MRHNGNPVLRTSQMPARKISLHRGERQQAVCPACDCWRFLHRGMLRPHRGDDGTTRCPGSGQRYWVDESPERWRARMVRDEIEAEQTRGGFWAGRRF